MTAACITDFSFEAAADSCRGGFDFTLTFEDMVLSLVPQASLLLLAPIRLANLSRRRSKIAQSPHLGHLKIVATILYIASGVLILVIWSKTPMHSVHSVDCHGSARVWSITSRATAIRYRAYQGCSSQSFVTVLSVCPTRMPRGALADPFSHASSVRDCLLHEFRSQWISAAVALYILYTQLGISFFISLLSFLMATGVSMWIGRKVRIRQREVVAATEKQVDTVAYTVGSTKAIRMLSLSEEIRDTFQVLG